MPDTAQTVPLFGFGVGAPSNTGKSVNLSAQLRTNLYVETSQDPDKSQIALLSRPGLIRFSTTNSSTSPMRAALASGETTTAGLTTALFVQDDKIVAIDNTGARASASTNSLATSSGFARSAMLDSKGIIIDGTSGYVFDTAVAGFDLTTLTGLSSASAFPLDTTSVCTIASRAVAVDPSELGRFRWSAAGDMTSWSALDFATAESSSDPLQAVFEMAGELLLLGTQTIEFWAPSVSGASGQLPFTRVGGANIQWGTTAIDTVRRCNDCVIFLGQNQGGNAQVVRLQGYTATVVSTPDVESYIATEPDLTDASAFFVTLAGHPFYVLNLTNRSWIYDTLNGTWDSWMTDGARYAGQFSLPAFGSPIISDYRDNRLYQPGGTAYTDDGNQLVREVVSKHAFENLARLSIRELRIDCETGVANVSAPSPTLALSWSKDGAHTFCTAVTQPLGTNDAAGYLTRPVWRNLGRSRDWVFKLTVTDPVKVAIIGAAAIFQP